MSKKTGEASGSLQEKIRDNLNLALNRSEAVFNKEAVPQFVLSKRLKEALDFLSNRSAKASTGFTNIVTSLAIKALMTDDVDIRYHQTQIQTETKKPAGFNFRGVSEKVIYPWLATHNFEGAKSGWQTRTFERPKPYFLDYAENIGEIKEAFLACYDEIEENKQNAADALAYLIYLQIQLRETKNIQIAIPATNDIQLIVSFFKKHFFYPYKASKGASRLPVLAFHAVYYVMMNEISRFLGKALKPLEAHSAADSQTGAVGDIEVANKDGSIFEAVEIKHGIEIDERILQDVKLKIMDKTLDRYYILTTHKNCEPSEEIKNNLDQIQSRFKCQVIVNGVMPSLRYYLRMLSDPSRIFPIYAALLQEDKAIAHEHREAWNKIVTE